MNNTNTAIVKTSANKPTALATTNSVRSIGIAGINLRELKEIAEIFIASGSFTDVKTVAQAQVKIMAGAELGFPAIISMTGVHFFNGKVSIGANLIASLIKDSRKYEYKITEHTDTSCTVAFFQRIGSEMQSLGAPVVYTIADAQKAQLTGKDNWKKYPKDMLFAACIRQGARRYCADILRGMAPDADNRQDEDLNTGAIEATVITEHGETVDTVTGEIINDVDAVTVDEVDPFAHNDEPDPNESRLVDLREAVNAALVEKVGGLASDQKGFLKGRIVNEMPMDALEKMLADLAAM